MSDWNKFTEKYDPDYFPRGTTWTYSMTEFYGIEEVKNEEKYPYYSIQQFGLLLLFRMSIRYGKEKFKTIRLFLNWQNQEKLETPGIYKRDRFYGEELIDCHFNYSHDDDFTWKQCCEKYDKVKKEFDEMKKKSAESHAELVKMMENEEPEPPEEERFADPVDEGLNKAWILSNGKIGKKWMGKFHE